MVVSASNYNQFVRKMKEKNVLMMFYIPSQQNSQSSIYPYFSTAKAFHVSFPVSPFHRAEHQVAPLRARGLRALPERLRVLTGPNAPRNPPLQQLPHSL